MLLVFPVSNLDAALNDSCYFLKITEYKQVVGFKGIDDLGNMYALSDGVLHKFYPDQGKQITFSEKKFGDITRVFFDDPMNLIIFFEQTGIIAFLDNHLAVKKVVRPTDFKTDDYPQHIAFSSQNGFWAYFPAEADLMRFDQNLILKAQSGNLRFITPGLQRVRHIEENGQRLFIADDHLWVFDLFANFLFKIERTVPDRFFINGQQLSFIENDHLVFYDFLNRKEDVFLLPESDVKDYFWMKPFLFLNSRSALVKYEMMDF